VISRRFRRLVEAGARDGEAGLADDGGTGASGAPLADVPAGIDPETGRPRKFAYSPNLVVVDGGAPQVAAARRALDELGIDDVALCGLAKRLEEVWLPDDPHPVVLPRTSEGLYLLQRVRDEAHRFAVALHRTRRSKSMTVSALDGIAGLGETRRKALLKHFGSLKRLSAASVEEVMAVPGVGRRTAEAVVDALAARGPKPVAVNMTTGEILDEPTPEPTPTTPAAPEREDT
jgi:excinuclease ABC subunit C